MVLCKHCRTETATPLCFLNIVTLPCHVIEQGQRIEEGWEDEAPSEEGPGETLAGF